MEGGLLDSGQGEEREQIETEMVEKEHIYQEAVVKDITAAAAAAGAVKDITGEGEGPEVFKLIQKPSAAAAAGARELQAGGWYLLGSSEVVKMMMEKVQKPSAAAAAGGEIVLAHSARLGTGKGKDIVTKKVELGLQAAAAGGRELQAGGSYSLGSGEGMEKVQKPSAAAAAREKITARMNMGKEKYYSLGSAFLVLTTAYAFLVLYVTETYTHSWMEKLQMLPLCIVAVIPPMLWAIMFGKFHG